MSLPIRILIVEDVQTMRELLVELLHGSEKLQLAAAVRNTWEARLTISRERPDLVLLDEVLPGESGLDLLPELSAQMLPVFLISEMEDLSRPIPPGVLGRLRKPRRPTLTRDRKRLEKEILAVWEEKPLVRRGSGS